MHHSIVALPIYNCSWPGAKNMTMPPPWVKEMMTEKQMNTCRAQIPVQNMYLTAACILNLSLETA
jgi:hypothetical protein